MTTRPSTRVCLLAAALLLGGCAASRHFTEGRRLAEQGQPEQGLQELRAALALEPTNAEYRLALRNLQAGMVQDLLRAGNEQQRAGQIEAAIATYQKAAAVDPQNEAVRRQLAQANGALNARRLTGEAERAFANRRNDEALARVRDALAEDAGFAPARALKARIDTAVQEDERQREQRTAAQSVMRKPISLQLRDANLRMVFESLSRVVGLNVILDRDVKTDLKTTIFVKDATVEDTVNMILLQNQLEKRMVNGNTVFIYPATPAKQKEYQELKIRVFELSNVDAKYMQGLLKNLLKLKDVVADDRSNAVVVRDTPDALAVAESLIAAQDVADPEVMLEVEVLEVSRDRLSNIGIKWPDGLSLTTPPGSGQSGELTLGELKRLTSKQLLVSPALSVGINAQLVDSDANILASPRIRVRQREKARILIGDRVPFVSGSNTIAAGASPIVSSTVQYLDVGIKLEVEPNVYAEDEVGIKINMEVSNIAKEIANKNTGDILYQIGTRSASTSLRLRDGETQVLAGLLSDQERTSAAKVPGLGQAPLLGRLFSNSSGDVTKTEIVLSITPHIVRGRAAPGSAVREIWSGTDARVASTPLRLGGEAAMRAVSSGPGGPPAVALPGAPRAPQAIPGAVIPGLRPQPGGNAPDATAPGAAAAGAAALSSAPSTAAAQAQPAEVQAGANTPSAASPPDAAPSASEAQAPQPTIFSPAAPVYVAPAGVPQAPGAGLGVQPPVREGRP